MVSQRHLEVLSETTVVDSDVHVDIPVEAVAERMDEPYRTRTLNGFCYPKTTGSPWDNTVYGKIQKRSLESPDEVREVLQEQFMIDYPIVNSIKNLGRMADSTLAAELMPAYNDVLVERFLDDTDFYGLASVAQQKPARAAEEIDRIGSEKQIVGLFVFNSTPYAPLGDPQYDPIYRAAEDNGLTVAFHGGAAGGFPAQFPMQNAQVESFFEVHALVHLWSQTLTVVSLIKNGVPEKFPDLNFVLLESGVAWAPYMMWRLNKEYSIRRSEAPLLRKSPEKYLRDQFYWGSQPLGEPDDPSKLQLVIDALGTDSMMFATDYPHWDFDSPETLAAYLRNTLSTEQREQLLHETPAEAFHLPV
ncbi:MAG: amidohydrolase family protein [Salinigranum sp.]